MTTENGMPDLARARHNIELLRDRLAYLDAWIAEHERATGIRDTGGVRAQEAHALRWALPVLEAEWDHLWRIHRDHLAAAEAGNSPESKRERRRLEPAR